MPVILNSLDVSSIQVFTLPQEKSVVNPAISVPLLDLSTNKRITYNMKSDSTLVWERVKKSPLRFTWEYRNPEYYTAENDNLLKSRAVVVISSDPGQPLPRHIEQRTKEHQKSKSFKTATGLFRYSTIVTVYYDRDLSTR